jgi:NDP-sugar pyrophosphorylase family protein
MQSPTLLILAAGAASRYGGRAMLDPVGPNGESIVEYSIYDAHRAGFDRVVFVIRKESESAFRERFSNRFGRHIKIEYVSQELAKLTRSDQVPPGRNKPWGTTHAILMACSTIREPFAAINVGDFYGAESYQAVAHHLSSGTGDYATVGFILRDTLSPFGSVARAICHVNESGFLDKIVELKNVEREGGHARNANAAGQETRLTGDEVVSMNMWAFTPAIFLQLRDQFQEFLKESSADSQAECFIPSTVNDLLQAGQARVKVLRGSDSWFGITYGEDHSRAAANVRRLIESGRYPKQLWG